MRWRRVAFAHSSYHHRGLAQLQNGNRKKSSKVVNFTESKETVIFVSPRFPVGLIYSFCKIYAKFKQIHLFYKVQNYKSQTFTFCRKSYGQTNIQWILPYGLADNNSRGKITIWRVKENREQLPVAAMHLYLYYSRSISKSGEPPRRDLQFPTKP